MAVAKTTQEMISIIDRIRNNPVAMYRYVVNNIEEMTEGKITLVDPTNPVAHAIEIACMTSSAAVIRNNANMRKLYPMLALTDEDLYAHMSDKDYLDRFSTPARASITILLLLDEVKQKAVQIPLEPNVRKLTIPQHSEFTVSDYSFTLQYPIDIRVSAHGGINVVYAVDPNAVSPIETVSNVQVDWSAVVVDGKKYLQLVIPILQMKIVSYTIPLNAVTGFMKTYNFTDNFYYCRAYSSDEQNGAWTEIRTTHTDQVYDPNVPTVVLKVLSGRINVQIPQIYFNNNLIGDTVRVDIYTTKGPAEVDLSNFEISAFSAKWLDRDRKTDSVFVAPINSFSGMVIYSTALLTGGKQPISFEELRERVTSRVSGSRSIPITPRDLPVTLADMGYMLVTNVDHVTNRQYLASRALPAPSDKSSATGMGCSVRLLQNKLEELAVMDTVKDNGNRITILPTTVFRSDNGVISVVPQSVVNGWLAMSADQRAATLNAIETLFTPFYYVLDVSGDRFDARAYRLDSPEVVSKSFFQDNIQNTNIAVSTKNYYFYKRTNDADVQSGYTLLVELQTDQGFRALATGADIGNPANVNEVGIHAHLSYIPPGDTVRQVFIGSLVSPIDTETLKPVDDRYVYRFELPTDFDIDDKHQLIFRGTSTPANLTTIFDLVIFLENYRPTGTTTTDAFDYIDQSVLENVNGGIDLTHERYELRFGEHLTGLWVKSRSVIGNLQYEKYTSDIPLVYPRDVYELNPNGTVKLTWNGTLGVFERNKLHSVGDPVLDVNNNPIIKHHIGEIIVDEYNKPTIVDGQRGILRQVDIVFLDGRYYFATNDTSTLYKNEVINIIAEWVTDDIPVISKRLLEQTELFYYPTTTLGYLEASVGQGEKATIPTEQTLAITYLITSEGYKNATLRNALVANTPVIIAQEFQKAVVSLTELNSKLKVAGGDQVIDVSVSGFLDGRYNALSIINDSMRLSISKRLLALSNQQLTVQDAIDVQFITLE